MRTIRASPHRITGESPNYLMLGRETRLPPDLIHPTPPAEMVAEEDYVIQLQERMKVVGEKLRQQQKLEPRSEEDDEPLFMVGDRVWLKSFYKPGGRGTKLRPKYIGPYTITAVLPHQTYAMERHGKTSVQHEGRIRLYQNDRVPNDEREPHNTADEIEEHNMADEIEEPSIEETVVEAMTQQQSWQPPRPRRKVRLPAHLEDFHLDLCDVCVTRLADNPILGQNSVSPGGGVVNLNDEMSLHGAGLERDAAGHKYLRDFGQQRRV